MTLGERLAGRNGLNLLRLLLATTVLVNHWWPLSGWGMGTIGPWNPRDYAVFGFFAISGYLISGSRKSTSGGRFLWHRFLRLFPALWVCLLLICATAWLMGGHGLLGYLLPNAVLDPKYVIPGSLPNLPADPAWDGSLWTLPYEAGCYLLIALLAWGRLQRSSVLFLSTLSIGYLDSQWAPSHFSAYWLRFGAVFLAGGALHSLKDRLPDSAPLAALCAVLVLLAEPLGWTYAWCLPLAYLMLWAGGRLPHAGLTERRDLSYGVYIYAFPITQLLVAAQVSVPVLAAGSLGGAFGMAALSRRFVENPARRWKDVQLVDVQREHARVRGDLRAV